MANQQNKEPDFFKEFGKNVETPVLATELDTPKVEVPEIDFFKEFEPVPTEITLPTEELGGEGKVKLKTGEAKQDFDFFKEFETDAPEITEESREYFTEGELTTVDKAFLGSTIISRLGGAAILTPGAAHREGISKTDAFKKLLQKGATISDVIEEIPQGLINLGTPLGLRLRSVPQKGVVKFAAETAVDPTTYFSGGATKAGKAKKLLTKPTSRIGISLAEQSRRGEIALVNFAGKTFIKGDPVFKMLTKVNRGLRESEKFGDVYQRLNRTFHSTTGHPITDFMLKRSRDVNDEIRGNAIDAYTGVRKKYRKLARDRGLKLDQLNEQVMRELETSDLTNLKRGLTDREKVVKKYADDLRKLDDANFKLEMDAGLPVGKLQGDVDYWARITTPEGKKWLSAKEGFPSSRKWTDRHGSQIQRQFVKRGEDGKPLLDADGNVQQLTLEEANQIKREQGFEGDFFHSDPAISGAIRADRTARAVSSRKFIDDTLDFFTTTPDPLTGKITSEVISGNNVKKLKDFAEKRLRGVENRGIYITRNDLRKLPETPQTKQLLGATDNPQELINVTELNLKGDHKLYVLPDDVAKELNAVRNTMAGGINQSLVIETFDKAQNWWKAWTLGIFPAFHTRNAVSNVYNNMLAGVYDPKWYSEATNLQLLSKQAKIGDEVLDLNKLEFLTDQEQAIVRAANKHGVLNKGWYGGDIPEQIMDSFKTGKWLTLSKRNKAVMKGREVGTFVENNARLAHFMAKVDEGIRLAGTPTPQQMENIYENAALSVKKYLFDYADLTPTEQNVFKRIAPFYTWTRKNLPLQLESLITKPSQAGTTDRIRRQIEDAGGSKEDQRILADYVKRNYPIKVRTRADGVEEYATIAGWLPIGDLFRVMNPVEEGLGMVSPFIKAPVEMLANWNFFLNSHIEEPKGEKAPFMGKLIRKDIVHAAKNIRLLNEIDRTFFRTGEGQLSQEARAVRLLTGFRLYPNDPVKGWEFYLRGLVKENEDKLKLFMKYFFMAERGQISQKDFDKEEKQLIKMMEETNKLIEEGLRLEAKSQRRK